MLLTLLGFFFSVSSAMAMSPLEEAAAVIGNFHEVAPGVYRGAIPDEAGMRALAKLGVRTDINLMKRIGGRWKFKLERALAAELGMRFVHLPMAPMLRVSDEEVENALDILQDPASLPVFFHCRHGEDRTGMLAGMYRVVAQGWTPEQAYREMLELGFHKGLVGVDCTFRQYFGMDASDGCSLLPYLPYSAVAGLKLLLRSAY